MKTRHRSLILLSSSIVLILQTGCFTPYDVQSIAESQFISFINALINTVTSDAITAAIGT